MSVWNILLQNGTSAFPGSFYIDFIGHVILDQRILRNSKDFKGTLRNFKGILKELQGSSRNLESFKEFYGILEEF